MTLRLDHLDDYAGQPTLRVSTRSAQWFFHKYGGGFASIVDTDGVDWISYSAVEGARGQFRGLPNMVHPGIGFHPGGRMCRTSVVCADRERVAFDVNSVDGKWRCQCEIDDDEARMTLLSRPDESRYWLLYEGTPGGAFDPTKSYIEDSALRRRACTDKWECRLPDPRGVWFGDERCRHGLYLRDDTPRGPDVVDSYWPMEGAMTVFGFGRTLEWCGSWRRLTEVRCTLRVGIALLDCIRARAFGAASESTWRFSHEAV